MSLTLVDIGQQLVVSTYEMAVNEVETGNPVTVLKFTRLVLYVILTSGKVPEEIAPVHEIDLITDKEL